MSSEEHASFHFSTRELPHSKRLPALREFFDQSIRLELDAEPGHAVEMEMHVAPGLRRAKMLSSLLRAYVANLPDRIADPRLGRLSATHVYDLIALAIGATDEGREIASQRGVRAARLEAIKADL